MKTNVLALVPVEDFKQATKLVAVPLIAANETSAAPVTCTVEAERSGQGHPEIQQQRPYYTEEHIRQQRAQTCCLL